MNRKITAPWVVPVKSVNGKEGPERMALQAHRSPESNRKVLIKTKSPGRWQRPVRVGLQGLATMNEAGKVIFRMAYSHVEATGDETKGNPLLLPYKQTSKTAQTTSQRVCCLSPPFTVLKPLFP